jgi:acyl-coenzyme A thioesterase PaaI-like protein
VSNREPDPAVAERLTAATRRIVDLVRRTHASGETAEQALAALERAAALLEEHAHPGPWAQRMLAFEHALAPLNGAPRDFAAFFPYSPLIGPRNPLAPPAEFEIRGGRVHGRVRFGAPYNGPPASVHGGVIAALFDELLGCANLANEVGGMTGTLSVKYRVPTPIGEELRLESWVERIDGRKVFTRGTIHHGDTLTAEAEGVFIQGSMQRFTELLAAAARSEAE